MEPVIFRYRSRELSVKDIKFINDIIKQHYDRGRTFISKVLCKAWSWYQPNGKLKEYPARDLLLRLEEKGFVLLPPPKVKINNKKPKTFAQIPFFIKDNLCGKISDYSEPIIRLARNQDSYLWDYLVHHYHYLSLPKLVGEHLKHIVFIDEQVVACLAWASAAYKVKDRDKFIGWDESTKRKNLYLIANNTRFLVLPWIQVNCLASKVLSLSLKRLNNDWHEIYGHHIYLTETFVDTARFEGICYKASNWHYVGQTKGSAKRGNNYRYHGQSKAIYLYSLHRHFRRLLTNNDQG